MTAPTRIGIAVVEHDGRFLVGIRGDDAPLAGFAEFPGGKCLRNESPRACAVRECREETGLIVQADRLLEQKTHKYPHGAVELHFWRCAPTAEEISADLRGFRWVTRAELAGLKFPPANEDLVRRLALAMENLPAKDAD